MPTGYTQKLMEQGQTFKEFAMTCARAFGACITMRDEPMDAPIPEKFEPDAYYINALNTAQVKLAQLEAMTPAEQVKYATERRDSEIAGLQQAEKREQEQDARLREMLDRVEAWQAPPFHGEFKDFMIGQIKMSFNGHSDYWQKHIKAIIDLDPETIFTKELQQARDEVERCKHNLREESERCANRTEWLRALRASLE